jgi:hypothetical protein
MQMLLGVFRLYYGASAGGGVTMLHVRPRWLRLQYAASAAAARLTANRLSTGVAGAAGSTDAQIPTLEDLWHVQTPEPQVCCWINTTQCTHALRQEKSICIGYCVLIAICLNPRFVSADADRSGCWRMGTLSNSNFWWKPCHCVVAAAADATRWRPDCSWQPAKAGAETRRW